MTRKWASTSKTYIPCDICGKRILLTRRNRQRCSNYDKKKGDKDEFTECQREAQRRRQRGEITIRTERREIRYKPRKGERECLKCEGLFKPVGKYNRICDKCEAENEHYREVATSYNMPVGYIEDYVNDY